MARVPLWAPPLRRLYEMGGGPNPVCPGAFGWFLSLCGACQSVRHTSGAHCALALGTTPPCARRCFTTPPAPSTYALALGAACIAYRPPHALRPPDWLRDLPALCPPAPPDCSRPIGRCGRPPHAMRPPPPKSCDHPMRCARPMRCGHPGGRMLQQLAVGADPGWRLAIVGYSSGRSRLGYPSALHTFLWLHDAG